MNAFMHTRWRQWTYARAWWFRALKKAEPISAPIAHD